MKLTKEQWKQLSDRIFLTLRPTQHPVAMKFIKTPEEFDAIPDIEFCQNKASTCKLIGMAAHFQGTFGLTPDHFSGYYCAMNNGCMELTQEFLDGAILYKQPTPWHHEQADAIKHIQSNLEYIPEKPYAGIVCSSLCNCNIEEPDVICRSFRRRRPSTCWPAMSRPTGRSSSSRSAASPTAPTRGCAP